MAENQEAQPIEGKDRIQSASLQHQSKPTRRMSSPAALRLLERWTPMLSGIAPAFSARRIRLGDIFLFEIILLGEISDCAES